MPSNEITVAVIDALNASGLPYMLVGSYSTNLYGIERSTMDADFVVELGERSILELARFLPSAIRIDPQMSFETITLSRRYVANVAGSPFKVEFFLLSADLHNQERFRRRTTREYLGRSVFLPTPEDVIITKLRWAHLGGIGRAKDAVDARDVIAVQDVEGNLDWDYIHHWCDQHGTRALLDEIRASIPPDLAR